MRLFVVCAVATSLMGCAVVAARYQRTAQPEPSCGWIAAGAAADLATVGVLGALLANAKPSSDSGDGTSIGEAATLAIGGLLLVTSGIEGLDAAGRCHLGRRARERELAQRAREDALRQQSVAAREQAWKLTVEAETAARAGDCARVSELDPKIAAIDTGMHDVVFARDLGVIRCRGSAL
jgi:hypothetical protein